MVMSKGNYPKYNEYRILNCAGEWERWQVPCFMRPEEVVEHRAHSVICMLVRKGWNIFVNGVSRHGPLWVVWDRSKHDWGMAYQSLDGVPESELYNIGC